MKILQIPVLLLEIIYLWFISIPLWKVDIFGIFELLYLNYIYFVTEVFACSILVILVLLGLHFVILKNDKKSSNNSVFIKIFLILFLYVNIFLTVLFSNLTLGQINEGKEIVKSLNLYHEQYNDYPYTLDSICATLKIDNSGNLVTKKNLMVLLIAIEFFINPLDFVGAIWKVIADEKN